MLLEKSNQHEGGERSVCDDWQRSARAAQLGQREGELVREGERERASKNVTHSWSYWGKAQIKSTCMEMFLSKYCWHHCAIGWLTEIRTARHSAASRQSALPSPHTPFPLANHTISAPRTLATLLWFLFLFSTSKSI